MLRSVLQRVSQRHVTRGVALSGVAREQRGLERGRQTNIRVTQRAFATEQDLLAYFKAFVDGRYEPPTDEVGVAA